MFPENMSPPFGDGRFFMTGYGNIRPDPARPMVRTLSDLGEAAESKYYRIEYLIKFLKICEFCNWHLMRGGWADVP